MPIGIKCGRWAGVCTGLKQRLYNVYVDDFYSVRSIAKLTMGKYSSLCKNCKNKMLVCLYAVKRKTPNDLLQIHQTLAYCSFPHWRRINASPWNSFHGF